MPFVYFRLFTDVGMMKLSIDLQMIQYRSVVESYLEFNMKLKSAPSKEFTQFYELFVDCQGKTVSYKYLMHFEIIIYIQTGRNSK